MILTPESRYGDACKRNSQSSTRMNMHANRRQAQRRQIFATVSTHIVPNPSSLPMLAIAQIDITIKSHAV